MRCIWVNLIKCFQSFILNWISCIIRFLLHNLLDNGCVIQNSIEMSNASWSSWGRNHFSVKRSNLWSWFFNIVHNKISSGNPKEPKSSQYYKDRCNRKVDKTADKCIIIWWIIIVTWRKDCQSYDSKSIHRKSRKSVSKHDCSSVFKGKNACKTKNGAISEGTWDSIKNYDDNHNNPSCILFNIPNDKRHCYSKSKYTC